MRLLKHLLCEHDYTVVRWHHTHGTFGNEPLFVEAELKCKKCGKDKYVTADRGSKFEKNLKANYFDKYWGI